MAAAQFPLKQAGKGALWIAIAAAAGLLLRSMFIPGLFMFQGWVPLIIRLIGEAIMIGGLLKLADAPDAWKVRELAIFSGLGTLPRPLLWAVNMSLPFLRLDWGLSGFPVTMTVLLDAGSFAAIIYMIDRIEVATGGKAKTQASMAGYAAAGVLAITGLMDLVGAIPAAIPLAPLATAALAGALFFQVKLLNDRLATRS